MTTHFTVAQRIRSPLPFLCVGGDRRRLRSMLTNDMALVDCYSWRELLTRTLFACAAVVPVRRTHARAARSGRIAFTGARVICPNDSRRHVTLLIVGDSMRPQDAPHCCDQSVTLGNGTLPWELAKLHFCRNSRVRGKC